MADGLGLKREIAQVAKDKGFTMADINTRHPWSRSDYLTLGSVAAIAIIIGLAGVVAAMLISA